ncbi:NAD-dependent epimerase/dehydratase family protein [Candidatus Fermentibacterales bacterium]|nr:NAD-dependent epimerase/dehydratase family protein [Candidatus Fermentibacterales bacterium]
MVHLVTGAAGFIGSSLTDRLLAEGERVIGVDCFRDYYSPSVKRANLSGALGNASFTLLELDLSTDSLSRLSDSVGREDLVVYHLAAQAGVRRSWGESFEVYTRDNVTATQRLLEWARSAEGLSSFVYASSSSVYGNTAELPMREDASVPRPFSPYGVTKLAGESLVRLYSGNYGLPSVSLRFFTVYGPRQRPDMAFHRFISAALGGDPIEIYGNGSQTRDFTYVDDVIDAVLAARAVTGGEVLNVGGGNRVSLSEAVGVLADLMGSRAEVRQMPVQKGDVRDTLASTELIERATGWKPSTDLRKGLAAELDWLSGASEA